MSLFPLSSWWFPTRGYRLKIASAFDPAPEVELKSVEGIEELNAYAAEGQGTLVIEFDSTFEPDQAMTDVRGSGSSQGCFLKRQKSPS